MPRFDTLAQAVQALEQLRSLRLHCTGSWDLPQVLHHVAQSVEYSISGFPALKPLWFRSSVGPLAFATFNWRGRMNHALDQAIPGAPAIAQGLPLLPALERATAALQAFDRHSGPLMPHFAYGALEKAAYTRAHLMHLADHWQALVP